MRNTVRPSVPAATVPVFVATSRRESGQFSQPYGSKRSRSLTFSQVDVSVPASHRPGIVEKTGNKPNPAKHFVATRLNILDGHREFTHALNEQLDKRSVEDREILIFVHGYNNNFADGTFRAAQITHDFKLKSVLLHYSWPSAGSFGMYVYDRDSASFARNGLAELLQLAAATKARKISILAHSMGGVVTMEALRTLTLSGDRTTLRRIDMAMLASPDIDLDIFEQQLDDVRPAVPIAVLVSRNDNALAVSRRLAGGYARVGDGSSLDALRARGVAVVDATRMEGGGHNVFASSSLIDLATDENSPLSSFSHEGRSSNITILAAGASILDDAASLVIYLPARLLTGSSGM